MPSGTSATVEVMLHAPWLLVVPVPMVVVTPLIVVVRVTRASASGTVVPEGRVETTVPVKVGWTTLVTLGWPVDRPLSLDGSIAPVTKSGRAVTVAVLATVSLEPPVSTMNTSTGYVPCSA